MSKYEILLEHEIKVSKQTQIVVTELSRVIGLLLEQSFFDEKELTSEIHMCAAAINRLRDVQLAQSDVWKKIYNQEE
jgi:hypothetical protein